MKHKLLWSFLAWGLWGGAVLAAPTHPCRITGFATEVQCGRIQRPLDPTQPHGTLIDVHFVVIPAAARNKLSDAVLLLAGGPGQSAIDVAAGVMPMLGRLNNRRDLVFIDQRGTGRSAPLMCADESKLPLQDSFNTARQVQRLRACMDDLRQLPHGKNGGLRFYTTPIAMQDMEAVRVHLGVSKWNLVGASYGTRAALEYMRQFPSKVRRAVLDGVAPPDMQLPVSTQQDGSAALESLLKAYAVQEVWADVQKRLPLVVTVQNPSTGKPEKIEITEPILRQMVRLPLYVPALASGLPVALRAAKEGDFTPLVGLAGALGGGQKKSGKMAMGMHFSVICAEDMNPANHTHNANTVPPEPLYRAVCQFWERGAVDSAFYTIPPAQSPTLILSGGADPVTPPRHGERVQKALGAKAQHIVVPAAGHGVMGIGCVRDTVQRFIQADPTEALPQSAPCANTIPRPVAFGG